MEEITTTKDINKVAMSKFFSNNDTRNIFNLFSQGKSIQDISSNLNIPMHDVEKIVSNKFFIAKLEKHVANIVYASQVQKIISSTETFDKLFTRVINNIDQIPPEICLKELSKMFPNLDNKTLDKYILNPKTVNIFNNIQVMKNKEKLDNTNNNSDYDEVSSLMGKHTLSDDENSEYIIDNNNNNGYQDSEVVESESSEDE